MPSGNKPLPEPMLTQIYVIIKRHPIICIHPKLHRSSRDKEHMDRPNTLFRLASLALHYSDVIMSAIASQITGVSIVCSTVVEEQIKVNIKTPRQWPLLEESVGDRWISVTKGSGKCLHLMTSSWGLSLIAPHCHSSNPGGNRYIQQ